MAKSSWKIISWRNFMFMPSILEGKYTQILLIYGGPDNSTKFKKFPVFVAHFVKITSNYYNKDIKSIFIRLKMK